jgi:hypothetical protein
MVIAAGQREQRLAAYGKLWAVNGSFWGAEWGGIEEKNRAMALI